MAQRIQLRRTKGWRKPEGVVSVVRGTDWGNPYRVGEMVQISIPTAEAGTLYCYCPIITPEIAVALFRIWVSGRLEWLIRDELAGKDLACWCKPGDPCHADVLLELANPSDWHAIASGS